MKINVKVKVGSDRQEVKRVREGYEVRVKSVAEKGKANKELLKLLKKYFNKPVEIVKGLRSKNKIIEVK